MELLCSRNGKLGQRIPQIRAVLLPLVSESEAALNKGERLALILDGMQISLTI